MPHFGVVLCSHNGSRFIEAQITSILNQESKVDSIHVHDFASRDDTRSIVQSIVAASNSRVMLTMHETAPGPAKSFIEALRQTVPLLPDDATIFFADQDDVWLPDKVETVRQEIMARDISPSEGVLLFHDVKVVDTDLNVIRDTYYTGNPFKVPRDLHPVRLLMANPAIGHTMLLTAPLARRVIAWPNFNCYMMHDWLSILVASRTGKIHYIPKALSLYRQHDSNVLGAYRTGRRVAPLARLMNFVDRVAHQAVCFSRATAQINERTNSSSVAVRLELACSRGYRSAAWALAVAAMRQGPTWQRKAIGLLLLVRVIVGPLRNAA